MRSCPFNGKAKLLGVSRSSFYYRPRPDSPGGRSPKRLDRIFTEHLVCGSRRLRVALAREGIEVGRRHVRRLMKKLGLWAIAPSPTPAGPTSSTRSSLPAARPGHRPAEPVWSHRHHLPPDAEGFLYPGRHPRLGDLTGAGVAAVQHADGTTSVWRRSRKPSPGTATRKSSTPRPGQPIHQRRNSPASWNAHAIRDQHGRPRALPTTTSSCRAAVGGRSSTDGSILRPAANGIWSRSGVSSSSSTQVQPSASRTSSPGR